MEKFERATELAKEYQAIIDRKVVSEDGPEYASDEDYDRIAEIEEEMNQLGYLFNGKAQKWTRR